MCYGSKYVKYTGFVARQFTEFLFGLLDIEIMRHFESNYLPHMKE